MGKKNIGTILVITTPTVGTLFGNLNLWVLDFLIPLNSQLQVFAVETLSYFPVLMWGRLLLTKNEVGAQMIPLLLSRSIL